ncbi:HalOD1 output domain-containing protein [Halobacteriaceae archaeon GCM10025711]
MTANEPKRHERPAGPTGRGTFYARHDWDGPARLSTTVVHALADAMNADPTEMSFALYDTVDPDALDALFRPTADGVARSGELTFTVEDYRVTIWSDGRIVVDAPAAVGRPR